MSENDRLTSDRIREQASRLRAQREGVGTRLRAEGLGMRLQSFGDGTVGLRIPVSHKPRVNTSIELVKCEVRLVGSTYALDVVERSVRSAEQSAAFFADLAQRLADASEDAVSAHVEAALKHWKSAFAPRRDLLSEEEMLGLYGELVILDRMNQVWGGAGLIEMWTGPQGMDHDFSLPGLMQIECKTTSPQSERLHISNEHQLEALGVPLVLACVRAAIVANGAAAQSLTDMVVKVEQSLPDDGSVHLFRQKLEDVGFDRHDDRYEEILLEYWNTRYYEVRDAMPRVTPADLRPGVSGVRYQIVTSDLKEYEIPDLPIAEISGDEGQKQ